MPFKLKYFLNPLYEVDIHTSTTNSRISAIGKYARYTSSSPSSGTMVTKEETVAKILACVITTACAKERK